MSLELKDGWKFGLGFWLAGLVVFLLPLLLLMMISLVPAGGRGLIP